MINFILGTLFGIFIATAGVSGVTKLLDTQVDNFKETIKENVK